MKLHTLFGLCAVLLLPLFSCDDFLEIEPQELLNSSDYMNTENQAEMAVASMYNLLRITSGNGPDGIYMDHHFEFFFGSTASDDAEKGSTTSDLPNLTLILTYSMNPTNSLVRGFYTHGWWAISRANYVLGHLEDATLPESLKNRMRGEAHFFKAYYYFYLLRHFGGMPILEHSVELSEFGQIPRASYTETVNYIISEFRQALDLLPERSQYAPADLGRATKGAARAYLARVMTYRLGIDPGTHETSWQDVYNYTSDIIHSGEYRLLANYAELFDEYTNFCSESIFEVGAVAGSGGIQLGFWNVQASRSTPAAGTTANTGWGFNNPTQDLFDAFDPTDPRLSSTIYGIDYNNGTLFGITRPLLRSNQSTLYHARKVALDRRPSPGSGKTWMLMRYADVLLMHAEAAYMLNKEPEAREYLNQVRQRARNSTYCKGYNLGDPTGYPEPEATPNLPDVTASGEALLNAIWDERRLELATEDYRTYDLIRTGRLLERVERVKDFQRDPANPLFRETGRGSSQAEVESSREIRVPGIRANILRSSLPGKNGWPIPVMPLPETESTYWNIEPNPY
ncbi:MAG: RagB/SusD family nutrient uptake outer membrane protein [Tannerellaceae bacterium]|jgi:hypothetical protein|nr:RagB/SusD family nutrient uptake outer membrane protein [Tannerellaceae bacterium]